MQWVAMFSQTGSEIKNLIGSGNGAPDKIVTNNSNDMEWKHNVDAQFLPHDTIEALLEVAEPCFITLHGYLRIISADIANRHFVYNGHPGLIDKHPELRGKDPQKKLWTNTLNGIIYPTVGSVVHKVTDKVDDPSTIVTRAEVTNTCTLEGELYNVLRYTSLAAWVAFMQGRNRNGRY